MMRIFVAGAALTFIALSAAKSEVLIGAAGPLSGNVSYAGEVLSLASEIAVERMNDAGGIDSEALELIVEDDACNANQAAAVADKMVGAGVAVVIGHVCSGASIAAMQAYDAAGIVMISPTATNPRVTDEGGPHIFRVAGRDDEQGEIAAAYLAKAWTDKNIALVHDGDTYGAGVAAEVDKRLQDHGVVITLQDQVTPGEPSYGELVDKLTAAEIDVLHYSGRPREAALIIQEARSRGDDLQLIGTESLSNEDFWLVAGDAGDGTLFTSKPDPKDNPEALPLLDIIEDYGLEPSPAFFSAYAALQAWAMAVDHAGTIDGTEVASALRVHEFETVIGKIGFDDKGDVTGIDAFVWYVWQDGAYRLR
ncbi:MAG: branched-chain amino acid ABC transporter substrate-binding protein [Geminicoccaceae bacterium]